MKTPCAEKLPDIIDPQPFLHATYHALQHRDDPEALRQFCYEWLCMARIDRDFLLNWMRGKGAFRGLVIVRRQAEPRHVKGRRTLLNRDGSLGLFDGSKLPNDMAETISAPGDGPALYRLTELTEYIMAGVHAVDCGTPNPFARMVGLNYSDSDFVSIYDAICRCLRSPAVLARWQKILQDGGAPLLGVSLPGEAAELDTGNVEHRDEVGLKMPEKQKCKPLTEKECSELEKKIKAVGIEPEKPRKLQDHERSYHEKISNFFNGNRGRMIEFIETVLGPYWELNETQKSSIYGYTGITYRRDCKKFGYKDPA